MVSVEQTAGQQQLLLLALGELYMHQIWSNSLVNLTRQVRVVGGEDTAIILV